jgi:hypothetical protein
LLLRQAVFDDAAVPAADLVAILDALDRLCSACRDAQREAA